MSSEPAAAPGGIDFAALFDGSPNPYLLLDPDLTILGCNQAYGQISGRVPQDLIGRYLFDAFPGRPDDPGARQLRLSLQYVLANRAAHTLPLIHYAVTRATPDGEVTEDRYWGATNTPVLNEGGEVILILHNPIEITSLEPEEKELADAGHTEQLNDAIYRRLQAVHSVNMALLAERRHMQILFEQAPGFIAVWRGAAHVFEMANKAFYQLVGHRDILGKPVRDALPEIEGQGFFELLDQVYGARQPFVGHGSPVMLQQHPGAPPVLKHVDFIFQPIIEPDGELSGIFVQGHDVSEAYSLARALSHQAAHDHLTGLANRREFERRVRHSLEYTRRTDVEHSLLYLDLDQFKLVNNTCGHAAGDEMLRQLSKALDDHIPAGALLARVGGDAFAVLLENCPQDSAIRMANELREAVSGVEFSWAEHRFVGSVSVGVVTYRGDSFTYEELLSTADSACFLAKEKGRNRVQAYQAGDTTVLARRNEMEWVSRLRAAMQEERLLVYKQRIVRLDRHDPAIDRHEILIRLKGADGAIIQPLAFIPAAEHYNVMPTVDRYVLRAVFRHIADLPEPDRQRAAFSINLSGATLNDDEFPSFIDARLAEYGVTPRQICFEITETTAIHNLTRTASLIDRLSKAGFQFALDDFGSGMSSFGYLRHLPVHYLKIDGIFVKDILDDPVDCAIVEAITKVAHLMGIQTVGEFVESDAIFDRLAELGVNYGQGFAIHEPEPLLPP
jgi:diguanylate cyclase (GGDEF)-like protein